MEKVTCALQRVSCSTLASQGALLEFSKISGLPFLLHVCHRLPLGLSNCQVHFLFLLEPFSGFQFGRSLHCLFLFAASLTSSSLFFCTWQRGFQGASTPSCKTKVDISSSPPSEQTVACLTAFLGPSARFSVVHFTCDAHGQSWAKMCQMEFSQFQFFWAWWPLVCAGALLIWTRLHSSEDPGRVKHQGRVWDSPLSQGRVSGESHLTWKKCDTCSLMFQTLPQNRGEFWNSPLSQSRVQSTFWNSPLNLGESFELCSIWRIFWHCEQRPWWCWSPEMLNCPWKKWKKNWSHKTNCQHEMSPYWRSGKP